MTPALPHTFTEGGATFTVTSNHPGYYDITISGHQVALVMPGGGDYTMNIDGTRGRVLDSAELHTEVLDRWKIVLRETAAALRP